MRRFFAGLAALGAAGLFALAHAPGASGAVLPGWPAGRVVREVRFRGLPDVRASDLERLLGVAKGRVPDSVATVQGLSRVAQALEAEGWLVARVDSITTEPNGDTRADLVVWLTAGQRHTVGRVTWDGLTLMTPEEAAALVAIVPGMPFRAARLGEGLARLVRVYEDRGRPAASASVLDLEVEDAHVDVFVRVFEGDSSAVQDVVFDGARQTKRSVLEKSMGNVLGLPYNRARLAVARQRLADLGVFTRVGEPSVVPIGPGAARVIVPVEEAQANSFDGAVGYQGDNKTLTGLADLRLDNLGGRARQAQLFWEGRGSGRTEFRLRYAEPLLFGLNLKGEVFLMQLLEDTLYTRTRLGTRLTFGAGSGARFWLALLSDRTVLDDGPVERSNATTTEAGFDADRRDDRLVPRRGYRFGVATSTAFKKVTERPEGTSKATQLVGRAWGETNHPTSRAAGARLGLEGALRLSNEDVVPTYDQDLVGGAATLRGYREGEFRASRWAVARAEFGVFTDRSGRAFAFVDQGVLYRPFADSTGAAQSETLYRVGFGVGIEAPIAPGRLSLTLGYGKGDGPLDGKIHLRLTSRF